MQTRKEFFLKVIHQIGRTNYTRLRKLSLSMTRYHFIMIKVCQRYETKLSSEKQIWQCLKMYKFAEKTQFVLVYLSTIFTFNLKNKATSNIKFQQIISNLGLDTKRTYMKEDKFSSKVCNKSNLNTKFKKSKNCMDVFVVLLSFACLHSQWISK